MKNSKKSPAQASKQGKKGKIAKKAPAQAASRGEKQGSSVTEINIEYQNRESTSRTGGMVYESKNVLYG